MYSPENVIRLKSVLSELNIQLDKMMIDARTAKSGLNISEKVSHDFLLRIKLNTESIEDLCDRYAQKGSTMFPIGLILRSLISDIFTFNYLMLFYDEEDKGQSLKNELLLLERDFVSSMEEVTVSEYEAQQTSPLGPDSQEGLQKRLERLRKDYEHLFDNIQSKKAKTTLQLRTTSLDKFFKDKNQRAMPHGMMGEKYKLTRLISRTEYQDFRLLFTIFKVLSQFQHYSFKSINLLEKDFQNIFFYYMLLCLEFAFFDLIRQARTLIGNSTYDKMFKTLLKELQSILK